MTRLTSWKFSFLILSIYLILQLIFLSRHELWGEEIQGFLIARDSASIIELVSNLRYEGHQILWYLVLFIVTRFSDSLVIMQLVHLLVAFFSVLLFVLYAPFSRLFKVAFIFGYFPFFEYSIISRNYSLTMFFLFLTCTLWRLRARTYLPIVLSIFLLAQTSAIGLVLAIALAVSLVTLLMLNGDWREMVRKKVGQIVLGGLILIVGFGLSVMQLIPPDDTGFHQKWTNSFDVARAGLVTSSLWRGYFPIPPFDTNFWRYNILIPNFQKYPELLDRPILRNFTEAPLAISLLILAIILSLFIFAYSIILLKTRRWVLVFYLIGTLLLLLLFYFKMLGYVRHYGFLYLIFICALWLQNGLHLTGLRKYFVVLLLGFQIYSGVFALWMDYHYLFSESKRVAEYITENRLENRLLIGDFDYSVMPISAYLNRKIYYPRSERMGSFIVLDNKRYMNTKMNLQPSIKKMVNDSRQEAVVIATYPLDYPNLIFLKSFTKSINYEENYYLYRVSR